MHQNNKEFIIRFYSFLQTLNYREIQRAYHADAEFSDPIFSTLNSDQVKAMWQMLLTGSKDLQVTFSNVHATQTTGECRWEAWYTFSRTGRQVHNIINSSFEFKDDKIYRQRDSFNLWRWSRYALGPTGLLFGWTPWIQDKVKKAARQGLDKFIERGKHEPEA